MKIGGIGNSKIQIGREWPISFLASATGDNDESHAMQALVYLSRADDEQRVEIRLHEDGRTIGVFVRMEWVELPDVWENSTLLVSAKGGLDTDVQIHGSSVQTGQSAE